MSERKPYNRKRPWSNVHVPESGQSVDNEITNSGAAADTPCVVMRMPGSTNDVTAEPASGVIFVDYLPDRHHASINDAYLPRIESERPLRQIEVPWDCPMVAIRADDGFASWFTPLAGLTINSKTVSPANYARYFGVPITHAIPAGYILDTTAHPNTMTPAQLHTWFRKAGLGVASHSWHHSATGPVTEAENYQEIVASVRALDDLVDPAKTLRTASVGYDVVGFVTPGGWSSPTPQTAAITTRDATFSDTARLTRWACEWSHAYLATRYGNPDMADADFRTKRHHYNAQFSGTTTSASDWVTRYSASVPPDSTIVLLHSIGAGGTSAANFKALIDRMAVMQAAGSIKAVTLNTFYRAKYPAPVYTSVAGVRTKCVQPLGGIRLKSTRAYIGDLEGLSSLTNSGISGTGISLEETGGNITPDGYSDNGKCLKHAAATQDSNLLLNSNATLSTDAAPTQLVFDIYPGNSHALRFDIKGKTGDYIGLKTSFAYNLDESETEALIVCANDTATEWEPYRVTSDDTWQTVNIPFGVPKNALRLTELRMYIVKVGATDLFLDNFAIEIR